MVFKWCKPYVITSLLWLNLPAVTWSTVNLNTATIAELQSLIGIGPKKASAIIAYRREHGGFKSTEQLIQVKGIGLKLYAKNLAKLAVVGEFAGKEKKEAPGRLLEQRKLFDKLPQKIYQPNMNW
ncbi:MAG: ComEA family DNA-binding protein [Neisseriaceae bacterium]